MLQVLGRASLRAVANYGPAVGTQGHNLLTSLRGFSAQAQPAEGAGADEPTLLAAMRQCLPPAACPRHSCRWLLVVKPLATQPDPVRDSNAQEAPPQRAAALVAVMQGSQFCAGHCY